MDIVTQQWIDELKKFDVPTVCNALEALTGDRLGGFMKPGMLPRTGGVYQVPMVGYAATAKVSAQLAGKGDKIAPLMDYYHHVREMSKPTIAVIQDIDPEPIGSFWGEVQATVHKSLGSVGTLTEGGVRDIKECANLGFSMYSKYVMSSHAYIHVETSNCPVLVGGLVVNPRDLLFCDHHGVVVIPPQFLSVIHLACERIIAAEMPVLTPCRQAIEDQRMPTVDELKEWRLAMEEARKEVTKLVESNDRLC
ncbi:RraA family protein [Vibrio sp. SS-MA-C1-2]|uniref:RraA family protein n=1 Tax=Vibrio sp. SS-MA-C1-2 TaxID=2908646 RepID=UPI001F3503B0|nr:RraA family protein [Vibrio sp. SS-MA-C1-2]UJF20022.1 RraA family protein [Vibrio sp. SS-MA-C1-2]